MDTGNPRDDVDSYIPWKRRRTSPHPGFGVGFIESAGTTLPGLTLQNGHTHTSDSGGPSRKRPRLNHEPAASPHARPADMVSGVTDAAILRIPPELLQHIFSFLDPFSLGCLLCVHSTFNGLINPDRPHPQVSGLVKSPSIMTQDSLWRLVRSRHWNPSIPRPMEGMTELQMWRLLKGRTCQFCDRKGQGHHTLPTASAWSSGPGPEGVASIWPFKIRTCGNCLRSILLKEEDLHPDSAALIPGLPSAFFTSSLNYIPNRALVLKRPDTDSHVTKYYSRLQLLDLNGKADQVRAYGPGAFDEWCKGLSSIASRSESDIARFEKWEENQHTDDTVQRFGASTPLNTIAAVTSTLASPPPSGTPSYRSRYNQGPLHNNSGSTWTYSSQSGGSRSLVTPSVASLALTLRSVPNLPMPQHAPAPGQEFRPFSGAEKSTEPDRILRQKAAKREDIERRCRLLSPPLLPATLAHMAAFQAALQIPMPLNENSWEVLRHRLLDQRAHAELKERERWTAEQADKMKEDERRRQEEQNRIARERFERERAEANITTRQRLRQIAAEYIDSHWAHGQAVNRASCPQFAAEVLTYSRQAFYDPQQSHLAMMSLPGSWPHRLPNVPSGQSLKLEDMKTLYKDVIKPYADRWGEDLFLCPECVDGKRFPFDGVIQHYCAKHTDALSNGTIVVYWKAAWPDNPPFNPDPVKHLSRRGRNFAEQSLAGPYDPRETEVVAVAGSIWNGLDRIRGMPTSLRVYVTLRQILIRYSRKFVETLNMRYFRDCISKRPELAALGGAGGLVCKPCIVANDPLSTSYYSLAELLDHFAEQHQDRSIEIGHSRGFSDWDWRTDLIWLPTGREIRALIHAPGMDYGKLRLIADVLPELFDDPVPHIESIPFDTFTPRSEQPFALPLRRESVLACGTSSPIYDEQSPRSSHGIAGYAAASESNSGRAEPLNWRQEERKEPSRVSYVSREEAIHYRSLHPQPHWGIPVDNAHVEPQLSLTQGYSSFGPAETATVEYIEESGRPLPHRYRRTPAPSRAQSRAHPSRDHSPYAGLTDLRHRREPLLSTAQSQAHDDRSDAERFLDTFDDIIRPDAAPIPYRDPGVSHRPPTQDRMTIDGSRTRDQPPSRHSADYSRPAVLLAEEDSAQNMSRTGSGRRLVAYDERGLPIDSEIWSGDQKGGHSHASLSPRPGRRVIELAPVSPELSYRRIIEVAPLSPEPPPRRIIETNSESPELSQQRIDGDVALLRHERPLQDYGHRSHRSYLPSPEPVDQERATEYVQYEDLYGQPSHHYVYHHLDSRRHVPYEPHHNESPTYEQRVYDPNTYRRPDPIYIREELPQPRQYYEPYEPAPQRRRYSRADF